MKTPRIFKTISDLRLRQSTDYGTRRQPAESCIIHGYCRAFCQYVDRETKNNSTYLIEDITKTALTSVVVPDSTKYETATVAGQDFPLLLT